jgi:hypothetical protein
MQTYGVPVASADMSGWRFKLSTALACSAFAVGCLWA